jgi:hypothetical protein
VSIISSIDSGFGSRAAECYDGRIRLLRQAAWEQMARGWESKAVEAQIETAQTGKGNHGDGRLSPDQIELRRKKEGLLLSRTRVLQDLKTARNPRYQKILQDALTQLESDLAALEKPQ